MKKTIIIFLAAVMVCVTGVLAFSDVKRSNTTADQPTEIGRFVLFQGNYVVASGEQRWNELGVFKIDTITGKTWKYCAGMSDGKLYEKWLLTSNNDPLGLR